MVKSYHLPPKVLQSSLVYVHLPHAEVPLRGQQAALVADELAEALPDERALLGDAAVEGHRLRVGPQPRMQLSVRACAICSHRVAFPTPGTFLCLYVAYPNLPLAGLKAASQRLVHNNLVHTMTCAALAVALLP